MTDKTAETPQEEGASMHVPLPNGEPGVQVIANFVSPEDLPPQVRAAFGGPASSEPMDVEAQAAEVLNREAKRHELAEQTSDKIFLMFDALKKKSDERGTQLSDEAIWVAAFNVGALLP